MIPIGRRRDWIILPPANSEEEFSRGLNHPGTQSMKYEKEWNIHHDPRGTVWNEME
jgi:hypothetical protein